MCSRGLGPCWPPKRTAETTEDAGAVAQNETPFVSLIVDRKSGAYKLTVGLSTPDKKQRHWWRINVNTLPDLLKGTVEGRTVQGSYAPANAGPQHWPLGSENWCNTPGTTLSWNLILPHK